MVALKARDSAPRTNAQKFYPSPFREWRAFRAMVGSRFANQGSAAPWAIEYDPFGVKKKARKKAGRPLHLHSSGNL
jgi:hypothetical protein